MASTSMNLLFLIFVISLLIISHNKLLKASFMSENSPHTSKTNLFGEIRQIWTIKTSEGVTLSAASWMMDYSVEKSPEIIKLKWSISKRPLKIWKHQWSHADVRTVFLCVSLLRSVPALRVSPSCNQLHLHHMLSRPGVCVYPLVNICI